MKLTPRKFVLLLSGLLIAAAVTGILLWKAPVSAPAPSAPPPATLADLSLSAAAPGAADLLRDELREALGTTGNARPQKRIDLLASFTGTLTRQECDALLGALLEPRTADTPEGWHAEYMHNLAGLLQKDEAVREDFARALATLARDPRSGETVRDYALQHLRQVWDHAGEDLRRRVEASFRELAADPPLASSALLSLHLLGKPAVADLDQSASSRETSRQVPDAEISPLVARILKDAPTADGITARLTALRIVGDRGLSDFREDLRRIASATKGEHALVRMAAVANLARFADPADRVFLESLQTGDPRVAHAARRALATAR